MPAVVGGGVGDIEETLAAGRSLARDGWSLRFFLTPGAPPVRGLDGPWDWPRIRRVTSLRARGARALTISPAWGVSAAPPRPGAFGRPGPWAAEVGRIESAYGPDRVLHVSLEEFARTLTSDREHRERFREGGVRARDLAARVRETASDRAVFARAFDRFRAFDQPHVLHVFSGFRRDRAFAREFPAAVQTGPLWPRLGRRVSRRAPGDWVWYASPASAERIAPAVVAGLRAATTGRRLLVVTPRPWTWTPPTDSVELLPGPLPAPTWRRRFAAADLRIVTGSRSLLEAMEIGGPFLYFNGILGQGGAVRRHRPEKLTALLALAARRGVPASLRRDLADFGRGRRVAEVVARAAGKVGPWARFPRRWDDRTFSPPFDSANHLLRSVARAMARPGARASAVVDRVRAGHAPV